MSQLKNWREDFKDLKPTVVGTGAAIYAAVLIVIFFLVMPSSTSSPSPDITVRETDYRVLAPAVWSSGYHDVNLVNDGKLAHEFVMFKTALTASPLLTH